MSFYVNFMLISCSYNHYWNHLLTKIYWNHLLTKILKYVLIQTKQLFKAKVKLKKKKERKEIID